MSKITETTLQIDLSKLEHNVEFIKSKLLPSTKILAVVKAFAYGSDAEKISLFLQDLKVDYLAVAYVKEGIALRKAGVHIPILVLHPQPINFKAIIDNCLEPSLYSFRVLNEFIQVAIDLKQQKYPIHIKFNTGLNRLGFKQEDIDEVTSLINLTSEIKITSIFSHLAASEDLNEKEFTKQQIEDFTSIQELSLIHI